MLKNGTRLFIRHTAPVDTINTCFEKIRVIPKIIPGIGSELFPLLVGHGGRKCSRNEEICDVCIPRDRLGGVTGLVTACATLMLHDTTRVRAYMVRIGGNLN